MLVSELESVSVSISVLVSVSELVGVMMMHSKMQFMCAHLILVPGTASARWTNIREPQPEAPEAATAPDTRVA